MEKIKHIGAVLVVIISAPFKFISWCCEEERIYTIKDVLLALFLAICVLNGILNSHMLSSVGNFIGNAIAIAVIMFIFSIAGGIISYILIWIGTFALPIAVLYEKAIGYLLYAKEKDNYYGD
ncbi:hypothetical protein B7939_02160 [Eggerthia catenaformis]|nr:hypothetical protein B7939_02160 [Eggerthia catenaformis]